MSKALFTFLILVFIFFITADCFSQTNDYTYQNPKKLNDGWDVSSLLHELLPQFSGDFKDPEKREIALKHIMTMTSGLDWNERVSYNNPQNSEWQMVESEDWMSFVVAHPISDKPGKIFNYNTGGMHLLSAVIKSATKLYAHQFAEKYLLHPMGIFAYQWNKDPMGYPCTGGTDGGDGYLGAIKKRPFCP